MDFRYSLSAILLLCVVSAASAISVKDLLKRFHHAPPGSQNEVHYLPGYRNSLPSKHYSGYISVNEEHGRQLFYYLVMSEAAQPSNDLIVWLTGGPGCSSMDAFTYEHGPLTYSFRPGAYAGSRRPTLQDIVLSPNPNSWAKAASVLYIDSPAGTGFSNSAVRSDYITNDQRTIDDLEVFARQFFKQYPELRAKDLYIAGESYGGIYVPLFTQRLLQHNQQQAAKRTSAAPTAAAAAVTSEDEEPEVYNLVGYIVGNAVTDDEFDGNGQVDFAYGMGLIDPATYKSTRSICKESYWNATDGSPCAAALDHLEKVMGPINQYDILGSCFNHKEDNASHAAEAAAASGYRRTWPHAPVFPADNQTPITNAYAAAKAAAAGSSAGSGESEDGLLGHTISCADRRHALLYYNAPVVRRAIHAGSLEEAGRWEPCSDVLNYTHTAGSMIPVHKALLQAGLRGLVLSGDHDYVVPFTGSRAWVYSLGLNEAKPWHAWSLPGTKQVSGYAVRFEGGLTFATVKGGGHMVPQTKPVEALALLQLWLGGKL